MRMRASEGLASDPVMREASPATKPVKVAVPVIRHCCRPMRPALSVWNAVAPPKSLSQAKKCSGALSVTVGTTAFSA